MTTLSERLATLNQLIAVYEQKYGRKPGSVRLLGVSKEQSAFKMEEAFNAGLSAFGESYLQEALLKMAALSSHAIEWHFIGPIQSNKTRKIAEHFAWVHSVADAKIAKRLNDQRPAHLPPLNICIQVNISDEKTKSGVTVDEVSSLCDYCLSLPHIKLRGLMAIPAEYPHFEDQCHAFHLIYLLKQQLELRGVMLDTLSMGMSYDFEAAIAEGATIIRIGTALFGSRG